MINIILRQLLLLSFLVLSNLCSSQAQQCLWAKQSIGNKDNSAKNVVTDAAGNVYVSGDYDSDSLKFGSVTLINPDTFSTEMFVVKYSSSGAVQWAETFGGAGTDCYANSMATDGNGNLYIAGNFEGPTITFGSTTLTNMGGEDIFITKINSSGNVVWAKSAKCGPGGEYFNQTTSIAYDPSGKIVILGYFNDSVAFGSTILINGGGSYTNVFVAKYDTAGSFIWAKKSSGPGGGYLTDNVAVDVSGNVIITGGCGGGATSFDTVTISPVPGSNQMFLVKLNSSGTGLWGRTLGDTCFVEALGIVTDASGNIYATGDFECSTMAVGAATLTNAGSDNIFLVKYNASGAVQWAKSAGGVESDVAHAIAIDHTGNLYIGGMFTSPTITFGATTLSDFGFFLAKYDNAGNAKWAKGGVQINSAGIYSVATDLTGNILVTGGFNGLILKIDTFNLSAAASGFIDVFTAKFNDVSEDIQLLSPEQGDVQVYPNPAINEVIVKSTENITSITICNLLGQVVYSGAPDSDLQKVNVSKLPAGVYILRINGTTVRKFVKE